MLKTQHNIIENLKDLLRVCISNLKRHKKVIITVNPEGVLESECPK